MNNTLSQVTQAEGGGHTYDELGTLFDLELANPDLDEVAPPTAIAFDIPKNTQLTDELIAEVRRLQAEDPEQLETLLELGSRLRAGTIEPIAPINEQLENNPSWRPVLREELERHAAFLQERQPTQYAFVQEAHAQLGESPANVHDLQCIGAIPVVGHQEYHTIYHTLEQYAHQDIPATNYELILFLNLPGEDSTRDSELMRGIRRTIDEVERFKATYPATNMRYFANTYRGKSRPIGAIRADLWDVIGYDLLQRGRIADLLVVSGDADADALNRRYLSGMADTQRQTGADIVVGRLKWQMIPGLSYDAAANRILRFQTSLDMIRDRYEPTLHTSDANTAVLLGAYRAVGGFNRTLRLGEMIDLTHSIRWYRSSSEEEYQPVQTVEALSPYSILHSHSRRLVAAMALGKSPYSAWDQDLITFGADDSLRITPMEAQKAEAAARAHGQDWIAEMSKEYLGNVPVDKRRRIVAFLCPLLGFKPIAIS